MQCVQFLTTQQSASICGIVQLQSQGRRRRPRIAYEDRVKMPVANAAV